MMRKILKVVLTLVIIIAAFLFFAPASLLDRSLDRASQGAWRLTETHGTLWNGNGLLTYAKGTVLAPLRWRFEPSALLGGAARWRLLAEETTPSVSGVLTFSRQGLALDGLSLHTSAAVLQTIAPPEMVQAMEGALVIDIPSMKVNEQNQEGRISGHWQNAQMVFQQVPVDLGNVTFDIDARQQGSQSTIKNDGGAVALDGNFQSDATGKPTHGTLKITPRPDAPEALLRLLSSVGSPDAQGSYYLDLNK